MNHDPGPALDLSLVRADGRTAVLAVTGEMDHDTTPLFLERCLVAADGHTTVILDMTGVAFCDSSGINALLHLHRSLSDEGGLLCLAAVPERVRRVLFLTGIDTVLTLYSSVTEALAAQSA
ncbi:STAS domain-containing protein [Streptomyces seoulensis]